MNSPGLLTASRRRLSRTGALGVLLTVAGLLGHVLAARAIGGSRVAYRDHLVGFVLILAVTGGALAAIGARFWPGRPARTVLVVGLVQALFGLFVYLERFSVHG